MTTTKMSGTHGFYKAGCICFAFCIRTCQCVDEENCGYLDVTQVDQTSYLDCRSNGCCGDFHDRYCCLGTFIIIGIVFGSLIVVIVLVAIIGVCYHNYKDRIKVRNRINVIAADDIPRPSPVSAPPVYKSSRVRPSFFTPQPFRATRKVETAEGASHPPPTNLHLPSVAASRQS